MFVVDHTWIFEVYTSTLLTCIFLFVLYHFLDEWVHKHPYKRRRKKEYREDTSI